MTLQRRIERLERRAEGNDDDPGYVAVEDLEQLAELQIKGRVKLYLGGISPDDWPDPEPDRGLAWPT